jgi:hypothetical protein
MDRVHSGPAVARTRARWRLFGVQRAGARGRQCSPAVAEEDEKGEAEPVSGSLEHDRWWRGGTTKAESGGGSSSAREWRRVRENSGVRGEGAGFSRGSDHPFIGAEGRRGGGNDKSNGFNAIDGRGGVKRA